MGTLKDYTNNWTMIFDLKKIHPSIDWEDIYKTSGMAGVRRVKLYLELRLAIQ